ncbi:Uncharacterised protein [Salmonella enterica subsp. enterica serovar Bovismorbificans]|nr:Uncharacterised protein [Salmonella enterica subsp. enterica serovar Bovismorbificans]
MEQIVANISTDRINGRKAKQNEGAGSHQHQQNNQPQKMTEEQFHHRQVQVQSSRLFNTDQLPWISGAPFPRSIQGLAR